MRGPCGKCGGRGRIFPLARPTHRRCRVSEKDAALRRSRADAMAALYAEGRTLEEIGALFGVSRERVRQVLTKHGHAARGAPRAARRQRLEDALIGEIRRTRVERIADAHRALGWPEQRARAVVARSPHRHALPRLFRLRRRARYLQQLRTLAAQLGRTPRAFDLNGMGGRPWFGVYIRAFGTMRHAQRLAGLEANKVGAVRGLRRSHCKRGHAMTPENVYVSPKRGARYCRTCMQARQARNGRSTVRGAA